MHTFQVERYVDETQGATAKGVVRMRVYAEVFLAGMDVASPTSRTFQLILTGGEPTTIEAVEALKEQAR